MAEPGIELFNPLARVLPFPAAFAQVLGLGFDLPDVHGWFLFCATLCDVSGRAIGLTVFCGSRHGVLLILDFHKFRMAA